MAWRCSLSLVTKRFSANPVDRINIRNVVVNIRYSIVNIIKIVVNISDNTSEITNEIKINCRIVNISDIPCENSEITVHARGRY